MYRISQDHVVIGIKLCKTNARQLISSARTLLNENTTATRNHAIALSVLAIEELGKATILTERLKRSTRKGAEKIQVEKRIFKDHKIKFDAGASLLPLEALIIQQGAFDPRIFDPDVFATEDVIVNYEIRLDVTFVDWCDARKVWKLGTSATKERVEQLLEQIKQAS
jgi:AbiV family abortive infection protein